MMQKFTTLIYFIFFSLLLPLQGQNEGMDRFIKELMDKMTLEEKIGQLNLLSLGMDITGPALNKNIEDKIKDGKVGGVLNVYTPQAIRKLQNMAINVSRLHIPLIFGLDVIHGYSTAFPIPLGLSSCWDMDLIERSARIAAIEASADGLNWTFSPMVDVCRDPRWGRIAEGSGEDAWYGSKVAQAMVRGYQGSDLASNNTIMSCVKHFALYGASEAGRDYNSADMSLQRMLEEYLPPYKAAIDAGAGSVMSSFNDINGIPATANKWLLTDLLRNQWGFEGFVVTDYTAIDELIPHGLGKTQYDVAEIALNAGVDMDMASEAYLNSLVQLVKDGKISEIQINIACKRILEAKYKLGLFEDPYRYIDEQRAAVTLKKPEFRIEARNIARKSMVLLKNENQTLPLKKSGSIALIGPLAKSKRDIIGCWSGAEPGISVMEGIQSVVGSKVQINYARGANITEDTFLLKRLNIYNEIEQDSRSESELINEAIQVAKESDIIVAVVGESQNMSGEASSMSDIGLQKCQLELLKSLKNTGKPMVLVLMNGRPLTIDWEKENADAILESWFAGSEGGNAIADVLFGDYNPSGKLTVTFPQNTGQIPLYYNHKNTGRPLTAGVMDKFKSQYLDISNDPLYPFGFGLSYTSFTYSDLKADKYVLEKTDTLKISVNINNTGQYSGEEVVQLYIFDLVATITRPVKELKGFKKIMLEKGEIQKVEFILPISELSYYHSDYSYSTDPGEFELFIGTNSSDTQTINFTVK